MHHLITAERGPVLVLQLGVQRLVPPGFVLAALALAGTLVQAVSTM